MADPASEPAALPGRRIVTPRRALAAVAVVTLIAFALDNRRSVRIGFVVAERNASLIWVLIVTAGLGFLAGVLAARPARRKRKKS